MGLYETPLLIASLLLLCIGSASSFSTQRRCPPSYCGSLQISYPFRLKGDKPACGDGRYELTCDGNRTIIDINSGKYYVKSISYSVGDEYIWITDAGLASGDCALPSNTLTLDTIWHDGRFTFTFSASQGRNGVLFSASQGRNGVSLREATFVNCTREIQSSLVPCPSWSNNFVNCTPNRQDRPYMSSHVSCLSGSNALVYVIFSSGAGAATVGDIPPACRILVMVPTDFATNTEVDEDVFKYLQNGISLKWANPSCDPVYCVVQNCYADVFKNHYGTNGGYLYQYSQFRYLASPVSQMRFFSCLNSAPDCLFDSVIFLFIKSFIVLIDALLCIALARILVRFILSILAVLALLVYKYHKMRVPTDAVEKFLIDQQSLTPTRYTYTDIIVMTRNFKDKIGQGGFGSVYKGKLLSGFQVAIKILGNSKCNGDDFISEVSTIGTIHHINIVRLVGFCSEVSKRALVYEYLPKGSLDKYIFSSEPANQRPFTLDKLIDIALGIARGIDYLHRGCNMRILHFDIKPPNILLDNSFNPKVSDFGLAKLFPKDYSLVALSAARGTIGYIAPELVSRSFGIISYKSDVYSFGMLLMEMAGGRRNVEPKAENTSQIYYPSWIYDQLDDQRDMQGIVRDVAAIGEMIHDQLDDQRDMQGIVRDVAAIGEIERKLSIVGLWCIQTRPSERPSLSRVIEMLQADVGTLQMPPKPFLSAGRVCSMSIRDPSMEASSSTLTAISEHESLT